MNNAMFMGHVPITTPPTSSDLQLCPPSPDPHDIFRRTTSDVYVGKVQPIRAIRPNQRNPSKKRTKMIRFHNGNSSNSKAIVGIGLGESGSLSGGIVKKKRDPSAPKITRPCTECGKRFWSWKALFGHMRCHPERPWRGINPPPNMNFHHAQLDHDGLDARVATEEDEYVAGCLLMLAKSPTNYTSSASYQQHHHLGTHGILAIQMSNLESWFECSSCKKVFGSHQACGQRASHKNVNGCFAITRTDGGGGPTEELEGEFVAALWNRTGEGTSSNQQHRCSIYSRIFPSGQALGGQKRLHWEKDVVPTASTSVPSQGHLPFRFDLNLPAHLQDDHACSSADLDLRLGL